MSEAAFADLLEEIVQPLLVPRTPGPRTIPISLTPEEIDRFFSKVGELDGNGCRRWLGTRNQCGYGTFGLKCRSTLAHRVAWHIANGPIPDDLFVLHKCDQPWCVNVEHLFLGRQKDNVQDMWNKGRAPDNHRFYVVLTEDKVRQIFQLLAAKELSYDQIARRFDVGRSTIRSINDGEAWRDLMPEGWVPVPPVVRSKSNKLTEEQVREIYKLAWNGLYRLREIAKMFSVSEGIVEHIKNRRTWRHLWKEDERNNRIDWSKLLGSITDELSTDETQKETIHA